MKKQVLVIHGAGTFAGLDRSNFLAALAAKEVHIDRLRRVHGDWKANMPQNLGDEYDVLALKMPDPDTPQYEAWKIWFEKNLTLLDEELILIGHSLGGLFLVKYLSENVYSKRISGFFSVAAPFFGRNNKWKDSSFALGDDFSQMAQVRRVFFYHSKDDGVVPFNDLANYAAKLPNATFRELDGRGHFNKDDFPEIIEDIKSVS